MRRLLVATGIVLGIWTAAACGNTGSTLTPGQAATATAVSAFATFDALPAVVKDATTTAVMATIEKGLNP